MFVLLAIAGFGCRAPVLPDPVVDHVDPAYAFNGEDRTVSIVGSSFYPQLAVDAWNGNADIDPAFSAWLIGPKGGIALQRELVGVGILDDRHLTATVEAGLPMGTYDLEVEGPTGARGQLAGAFTITDSRAAQLVLASDKVIIPVTDAAQLTVTLADLAGDPVAVPFELIVGGTLAHGAGTLTVDPGTLRDPITTADGLRGFVDDGVATFSVRSSVPDNATITVVPADASAGVLGDSLPVVFNPGDDWHVKITLPPEVPYPLVFPAGQTFDVTAELVDQYDNPVSVPSPAWFYTSCSGDLIGPQDLDGPTIIAVTPHVACDGDRVTAWGLGESLPYTVIAGPADHFVVAATEPSLQAGDLLTALVDPQDADGNHSPTTGPVLMTESVGGFQSSDCFGAGELFVCTGTVTRAGSGLTVTATNPAGLTGTSDPFSVSADDVPGAATVIASGPAIAGLPLPVEVALTDTWGNDLPAPLLGANAISVHDELGEAECLLSGYTTDQHATFDCTLYTARSAATLTADVDGFSVTANADVVHVVNGPLGSLSFAGEAPVVAGEALTLVVTGFDAWGNPYLIQADPVVDLRDDSGTFSVPSVVLGADATAIALGSFTRAGPTSVHGSQGGAELGASDAISVLPAGSTGLRVTPAEPWAWVGQPLDVVVEVVDPFGNRTADGASATLASTLTGSAPVGVTVVDGVGDAPFTWVAPAFTDTLTANAGPLHGQTPVAVAVDCVSGGPTAAVSFGGLAEAVGCVDPLTGLASITGDLTGSAPGTAGLVGYGLAERGGVVQTGTQPLVALSLPGVGPHALRALVVDAASCGAEVDAVGWTGPDDGTPTGPITVTAADPNVAVFDTTVITVADVVDCSGDPAAYQDVELRTTGGALTGLIATGQGLALELDALGGGVATLTTAGFLADGTLEIHATAASGAGGGVLSLPVVGDNLRPSVLTQTPSGASTAVVSTVTLVFSEPLLATTVLPANFLVTGPAAVSVIAATQAGSTVTLTLSPAADASLGGWTVTAMSALRDVAGNKLAGTWGPSAADYTGGFGGGVAPAALTCTSFDPADLVLVPDGDPGQPDAITIGVSSVATPAWWVVEVRDEADMLVWQNRWVPVGPNDAVSWLARDLRGLVVENGSWHLETWPDDGLGNRGTGCAVDVAVNNPSGLAPGWGP